MVVIIPVSYTHLDVYKRQSLCCVPRIHHRHPSGERRSTSADWNFNWHMVNYYNINTSQVLNVSKERVPSNRNGSSYIFYHLLVQAGLYGTSKHKKEMQETSFRWIGNLCLFIFSSTTNRTFLEGTTSSSFSWITQSFIVSHKPINSM